MSVFSKKNMIFCPLFPRKFAAKVQQKMHIRKSGEKIFTKNDRFIYLRWYTILIQARLKMKYWIADDKAKPIFANIFERSCVWAAFCERTFGGIGKAKAASEVLQKAPCAKPRCPHCTATTSTFFGGNPPFKGRGVPKKAHILRATLEYGLHFA